MVHKTTVQYSGKLTYYQEPELMKPWYHSSITQKIILYKNLRFHKLPQLSGPPNYQELYFLKWLLNSGPL
jgi:hypothetical protein